MPVAQLGKQEPPPIADVGIIDAKLVSVIPQGQRLGQVAGQRLETPEMLHPFIVAEAIKTNRRRPAVITEPQYRLRKIRRFDRIADFIA